MFSCLSLSNGNDCPTAAYLSNRIISPSRSPHSLSLESCEKAAMRPTSDLSFAESRNDDAGCACQFYRNDEYPAIVRLAFVVDLRFLDRKQSRVIDH